MLLSLLPACVSVVVFATAAVAQNVCTVTAIGNGQDDGPNIQGAFDSCSSNARIELTGNYTVGTVLNTTNLYNVEIYWSGNVTYTPNITYWSPNSYFLTYQNATTYWLLGGENILLHGGGTLDANGQVWWDYFAENPNAAGVAGGSSRAFARPVPLTVYNATNVVILGHTILNSPFWHNFVINSQNVVYDSITLDSLSKNASAPAANSDGWDIYRSSHVIISNSNINNDDDCVSFKPNSTYISVSNLHCNGSHGISVGSLGQYAGETDIVSDVYVSNITMLNAQNGARIKVFGGSNSSTSISGGGTGYVRNITYKDFYVDNVDYPITLSQCYDTSTGKAFGSAQCEAYPAMLNISDVHFINVHGTSSGAENGTVVTLECSQTCQDITATQTNLTAPGFSPVYLCANLANESLLDFTCTNVTV